MSYSNDANAAGVYFTCFHVGACPRVSRSLLNCTLATFWRESSTGRWPGHEISKGSGHLSRAGASTTFKLSTWVSETALHPPIFNVLNFENGLGWIRSAGLSDWIGRDSPAARL
jgi:hypothetical protein